MKLSLVLLTTLLAMVAATPSFHSQGNVFGVSPRASFTTSSLCTDDIIFSLRGGAVHESSTLADLDSLIQSAALNDKLTVIDFTATWVDIYADMISYNFFGLINGTETHPSEKYFRLNIHSWCGPCKMIAPIFKELSEEHGSKAQFIKVDVE